jgi:hypothetical protein
MQWLIENKQWVFSGFGVFILGIIINFIFNKYKNGVNLVNKSTVQTINNGHGNYQATGDIFINSPNSEKPKLKLDIETLGANRKSISSSFQIGGTGEKEFTWNYIFKIINESSFYAYNCRIESSDFDKFDKIDSLSNIGSIKPHETISKRGSIKINKAVSGHQLEKYTSQKFPSDIRPLCFNIIYENNEGTQFSITLNIDLEGKISYS